MTKKASSRAKAAKPKIRCRRLLFIFISLLGILCSIGFSWLAYRVTSISTTDVLPTNSRDWSVKANNDQTEEKYSSDGSLDAINNNNLPQWMQDYFQWHKEQRQILEKEHANGSARQRETDQEQQRAIISRKFRFLLMECWSWNPVCGGTADRLRSIPFMILVAHQTKRILLIHWERPAPLEEFLLPPAMMMNADANAGSGLDWRVPSWLIPHLANQSNFHAATRVEKLVQIASYKNQTVVTTRLQSHDHGAEYYNAHRDTSEPLLRDVYRSVWQRVFTPTPPIANLIRQELKALHLVPGQYAAAHVRALYLEVDRKPEQLRMWAENAVNCASMLRPGGPIYFASDSTYAIEMAIAYGKTKQTSRDSDVVVVAARSTAQRRQPLHLDKTNANTNASHYPVLQPSDFYDTFVDLYLLGMSRCLTYNIGGYGKWGLMLGYNSSCGMRHQKGYGFKKDGLAKCHWVPPAASSPTAGTQQQRMISDHEEFLQTDLLPPPMD